MWTPSLVRSHLSNGPTVLPGCSSLLHCVAHLLSLLCFSHSGSSWSSGSLELACRHRMNRSHLDSGDGLVVQGDRPHRTLNHSRLVRGDSLMQGFHLIHPARSLSSVSRAKHLCFGFGSDFDCGFDFVRVGLYSHSCDCG